MSLDTVGDDQTFFEKKLKNLRIELLQIYLNSYDLGAQKIWKFSSEFYYSCKLHCLIQYSAYSTVSPHIPLSSISSPGYGHIVPNTRIGRLFAVLYAMIGVPLTCILMATNSNVLSLKLLHIYNNLKVNFFFIKLSWFSFLVSKAPHHPCDLTTFGESFSIFIHVYIIAIPLDSCLTAAVCLSSAC